MRKTETDIRFEERERIVELLRALAVAEETKAGSDALSAAADTIELEDHVDAGGKGRTRTEMEERAGRG